MSAVNYIAAWFMAVVLWGAVTGKDDSRVAHIDLPPGPPAIVPERPPLKAELVKDCEFSDPCRFRSVFDYQRDVRRLAMRVDFAERDR